MKSNSSPTIYWDQTTTPVGKIVIEVCQGKLFRLDLAPCGKSKEKFSPSAVRFSESSSAMNRERNSKLIEPFAKKIKAVLLGETRDIPLFLEGTPFQKQVWKAVQKVPYGSTISYSELAETLGRPGAARAVGSALAKNTIAILIPCHRVLPKTSALGQYRWGKLAKQDLLSLEKKVLTTL